MVIQVIASATWRVHGEADIAETRRMVRELATKHAFDAFAVAAIVTASSELSRNIWRHAKRGEVLLEAVEENGRLGLRLTFRDEGPGIPDIARVMQGGYSSANTMGLGLSGSKRLVDAFEISSAVGQGTRVILTKWKRRS
jgi:serine/threonine-protein kinase RsbT